MVSKKDREHFANIARANAQEEEERQREAALRSPGENIAIALQMSEEFMRFMGPTPDKEKPIFSLSVIWREQQAKKK